MSETCSLCQLPFSSVSLRDDDKAFCCMGCFTVFQILSSKEVKENFHSHPIFLTAVQEGIISNPHAASIQKPLEDSEKDTIHFEISNLWCTSCADLIRLVLQKEKGIHRCMVDYATDLALIEYSPRVWSKEALFAKIEKIGYQSRPLLSEDKSRTLWVQFAISLFCTLNLMCFAYPLYFSQFNVATEGYEKVMGVLSLVLAIPLITYCSSSIWKRFWLSLKVLTFGMETLVLLGVFAAFVFSLIHFFLGNHGQLYFDSMGMVISLVLLGKILEKKAKFSAKESLFRLTRTFPKKGFKKLPSGDFVFVSLKEIQKGDLLLARAGEKVVLDGVVEQGEALVDESIMTGESIPKKKVKSSSVIAGSILKKGSFEYRVTNVRQESLLSKIFQAIEKDITHKKRFNLLLDQLIKWFVPFVLLLAGAVAMKGGFLNGLSVLLISCPCAIGIAIPLAESLLVHRFAALGALVRNRGAFSILAKNPFFVFDKTGTLTEGRFCVESGLENLSQEEKAILKGMTAHSTHPISSAIYEALTILPHEISNCEEKLGRGLIAKCGGKIYLLGSEKLLLEHQISSPSCSKTVVYFAHEKKILAQILLGDTVKKHLPKLKGAILSGDSSELVTNLARECGFLWGKGGCSPLQKKEEIERLKKQYRHVVMVGDGVNDAPALTVADVGIAVSTGSDASVEISDIFLTANRLDVLNELILWAKRGRRVIFANLFWAFFYNIVGIGLAVGGLMTPLFSALAMTLSGLFVTVNSYYFLKRKSELHVLKGLDS